MYIVLQSDGNPVKQAAIATRFAARRRQFRFRFLCLVQSKFRRDGEIGVQFGIVAVNAWKKMFDQLHGREFSRAEKSCQFSDGEKGEGSIRHEPRNLTKTKCPEAPSLSEQIF